MGVKASASHHLLATPSRVYTAHPHPHQSCAGQPDPASSWRLRISGDGPPRFPQEGSFLAVAG